MTKDLLGLKPGRGALGEMRSALEALRAHDEFDLLRLRGLVNVTRT